MKREEKEAQLRWIVKNYQKVPLESVMEKLEDLLDGGLPGEDPERELAESLGRSLTSAELFRLRPLFMELDPNDYEEE